MAKRRSNAEIKATQDLHCRTHVAAMELTEAINPTENDDTWVSVRAADIFSLKAEFQHERADVFVVRYESKDVQLIERIARVMKAELIAAYAERGGNGHA